MTVDMEDKEPVDFFHLFFDGHILDLIHRETVRYTEQYLEREDEYLQAHPKARAHDWRRNPLTLKEVEVFLALIIAMGICGFPTLRYMACMTQNSSAMFYAVMHILVHDIHIMVMMFLTRMKRGQSCMVHITIYVHVIPTSVHVCACPRNTACSHIHVSTTCLYIAE